MEKPEKLEQLRADQKRTYGNVPLRRTAVSGHLWPLVPGHDLSMAEHPHKAPSLGAAGRAGPKARPAQHYWVNVLRAVDSNVTVRGMVEYLRGHEFYYPVLPAADLDSPGLNFREANRQQPQTCSKLFKLSAIYCKCRTGTQLLFRPIEAQYFSKECVYNSLTTSLDKCILPSFLPNKADRIMTRPLSDKIPMGISARNAEMMGIRFNGADVPSYFQIMQHGGLLFYSAVTMFFRISK